MKERSRESATKIETEIETDTRPRKRGFEDVHRIAIGNESSSTSESVSDLRWRGGRERTEKGGRGEGSVPESRIVPRGSNSLEKEGIQTHVIVTLSDLASSSAGKRRERRHGVSVVGPARIQSSKDKGKTHKHPFPKAGCV